MENIKKQNFTITKLERQKLLNQNSFVIWLTGLSGSGKSTLSDKLCHILHNQGRLVYSLDGDNVRFGLNKDLGFTDSDRKENIRRISEVSKLMIDSGVIVITSFISPFISDREMAKSIIGEDSFLEIYIDSPINICEERDPKGLYKKVRNGEIKMFTGIDSPYEPPTKPFLHIKTNELSIQESVDLIFNSIKDKKIYKE